MKVKKRLKPASKVKIEARKDPGLSFGDPKYREECAKNATAQRIKKRREAYNTLKAIERHPDYKDGIINREYTV